MQPRSFLCIGTILFLVIWSTIPIHAKSNSYEIKNVTLRTIQTQSFQRIAEYFTKEEYTGNRLLFRTHPTHREGLYFIINLGWFTPTLPPQTEIQLEYFTTESPYPFTETFNTGETLSHSHEIFIGLTDPKSPLKTKSILAWRVTLRSPEKILAQKQSFLWEVPK